MRSIKYIVVHCTATPQNTTLASIQNYWSASLRWKNPGYHYIIPPDGQLVNLLSPDKIANGVAGFNSESVHIAYIGGVDDHNKPLDNRTKAQRRTLFRAISALSCAYPGALVRGHRNFPNVAKACPSFDVEAWLQQIDDAI